MSADLNRFCGAGQLLTKLQAIKLGEACRVSKTELMDCELPVNPLDAPRTFRSRIQWFYERLPFRCEVIVPIDGDYVDFYRRPE